MNYGLGYRPANKYKNRKIHGFDSTKEARRWQELCLMERAGRIKDLQRQVEFELTPLVREPDTIGPKGGVKKGRVIMKGSSYIADFTYTDTETGKYIVEDVKGYKGGEAYRLFVLKKKMLYHLKGILIQEV